MTARCGVGQSAAYGQLPTVGPMNSVDSFGTTLTGSHPFSLVLPLKDAPDLQSSLVSQGKTADPTGAVKLINGNIECTSCHSPHVQAIDRIAQQFLVRDSSNGRCAWHVTIRTGSCRGRSIRWRVHEQHSSDGDQPGIAGRARRLLSDSRA